MDEPFKPGEVIDFCGTTFEVIENHGDKGTVKELPDGPIISGFPWRFEGVECTRVEG